MTRWWIPRQKQYLPETKRWYCDSCEKRTAIERNPEWDGQSEGDRPAPKWFVRCAACKERHLQSSGFECPNCGYGSSDETTMVSCTEPISSYWASMEYGGNLIDWDETHQCPKCRKIFTVRNGNY